MTGIAIKFTPSPYRPKKLAACYEDLAKKGWILKEKGLIFDHFRFEEPKDLVYQIEYMRDQGSLVNTQRRRRLKGGWDEVADRGMVHVYVADRDMPHEDMPPDEALRREVAAQFSAQAFKWLLAVLAAAAILFMALIPGRGGSAYQNIVAGSEIYLFLLLLLAGTAFVSLRQIFLILRRRSAVLSQREEKTVPWRRGVLFYNALVFFMALAVGASAVLAGVYLKNNQSADLPQNPGDMPLVFLEELENVSRSGECKLTRSKSLLAPEMFSMSEQCRGKGDYNCYTYQDFYLTRSPAAARRLAEDIARHSVWTARRSDFEELSVEGYDKVISSGVETVAVRGSRCIRIIYKGELSPEVLLEKLRDRT